VEVQTEIAELVFDALLDEVVFDLVNVSKKKSGLEQSEISL
jgi:hypothetical protein